MGSMDPQPQDLDDASSWDFPDLPPFPANVPTVPLVRIDLGRLLRHDADEDEKLWRACCDLGFFYLDLGGSGGGGGEGGSDDDDSVDGAALLSSADALFRLGADVFALPVREKKRFDMRERGSYFGYKGYGDRVVDRGGTRDRNEFWNVSKDDVLGVAGAEPVPSPDVLRTRESRALLERFVRASHAIVRVVLGRLNARLGLPEGVLDGLHGLRARSGDHVRWVKAPPQPADDRRTALGEHTDYGSVTVLFNRLGGLQVLPPGEGAEWTYVKPLRGHCVVNLGDAMVKFTAGVLRSNIHRVVSCPGEQAEETRYSLVYFSRPEDEVVLKVLAGSDMIDERVRQDSSWAEAEEISARQWTLNRAMGRRVGGDWKKGEGTDKERIEKSEQERGGGVAVR